MGGAGRPSEPPPGTRLPWLDGLRAVAILLVISRHVFDRPYAMLYNHVIAPVGLTETVALTAASIGWAGVGLFFVISGFLVAGGAMRAVRAERFYAREFLAKRFVRVFLPAIVFLILYRIFSGGQRPLLNFLFVTNYFGNTWLAHFWSLDVEAHFYLAVALLVPLTRISSDGKRLGWSLLLFSFFFSGAKIAAAAIGVEQSFYTVSHWQLDFFAAGAALRLLSIGSTWRSPGNGVWIPVGIAALGAAGVVASYPDGILMNQGSPLFLTVALALILVMSLAFLLGAAHGFGARVLSAAPLRAIGLISFSVYIVHLPLIDAISDTLVTTLRPLASAPLTAYLCMLAVSVFASLAIGTLFYFAIERPLFGLHSRIRIRPATRIPTGAPS